MTPGGQLMKPEDWDAGFGRSIGMFLNGNGIRGMDTRGARVVDDSFLLLFNAHDEALDWVLPPEEFAPAWRLVIDTAGVPEHARVHRRAAPRCGWPTRAWWCCRRWPRSARRPTPGGAAASVPTIAPVPVSMRPDADAGDAPDTEPKEPRNQASRARWWIRGSGRSPDAGTGRRRPTADVSNLDTAGAPRSQPGPIRVLSLRRRPSRHRCRPSRRAPVVPRRTSPEHAGEQRRQGRQS